MHHHYADDPEVIVRLEETGCKVHVTYLEGFGGENPSWSSSRDEFTLKECTALIDAFRESSVHEAELAFSATDGPTWFEEYGPGDGTVDHKTTYPDPTNGDALACSQLFKLRRQRTELLVK